MTREHRRVRTQELSLLHVFNAIMVERSVTRAAAELGMTQPAVSNAIARMRLRWQDPLFTRRGRQIEPTAYAFSLWEQIQGPLRELSGAMDQSGFVPADSQRKFRIAATDQTVEQLWQPLLLRIASAAPAVDIYAVPFSQRGAVEQLREARIDLAIGPAGAADRSLRSRLLFSNAFCVAMGSQHPLAGKVLSLQDFLQARHLMVSRSGEPHGHVDRALQRENLARRVAATVNHYAVVPTLLQATDMLAVVPQRVAQSPGFKTGLWLTEPPLPIDPTPIHLIWHVRQDRDPGLHWLRGLVEELHAAHARKES